MNLERSLTFSDVGGKGSRWGNQLDITSGTYCLSSDWFWAAEGSSVVAGKLEFMRGVLLVAQQ